MRKRLIDPEIYESAESKEWTTEDFVVMVAAISAADDQGRGRVTHLKKNVISMINEKKFTKAISNLSDSIIIYDKIYFFLPKFSKYQWITKPKPSKFPDPTPFLSDAEQKQIKEPLKKIETNSFEDNDLTSDLSSTQTSLKQVESDLSKSNSNRIGIESNSKQTESELLPTSYSDLSLPLLTNYEEYEPKNFEDQGHLRNKIEQLLKSFTQIDPDKATITRFLNIVNRRNGVKKQTAFRFLYENCMEFGSFTPEKRNFAYLSKRVEGKIEDALAKARDKLESDKKLAERTEVENMSGGDTLSLLSEIQDKFSVK